MKIIQWDFKKKKKHQCPFGSNVLRPLCKMYSKIRPSFAKWTNSPKLVRMLILMKPNVLFGFFWLELCTPLQMCTGIFASFFVQANVWHICKEKASFEFSWWPPWSQCLHSMKKLVEMSSWSCPMDIDILDIICRWCLTSDIFVVYDWYFLW